MFDFSRAALAATLAAAIAVASAAEAQEKPEDIAARQTLEQYDADTVLATVGDGSVTLADMIAARQALPPQLQARPADELFMALLDRMMEQRLLSGAARSSGLAEKPEAAKDLDATRTAFTMEKLRETIEADPAMLDKLVAAAGLEQDGVFTAQLAALERGVLSQLYIRDLIEPKLTDEALAALETEMKADPEQAAALTEVRARHILVKTEAEAQDVIKALEGGAEFETLAKERSTGPSGKSGGDLGYFRRGQMVPSFDEAVFKLENPGDVSGPVKSDFGWHVIKLEDRRISPELLRQFLIERIGQEEIARLKEAQGYSIADKLPPSEAITKDELLKAK